MSIFNKKKREAKKELDLQKYLESINLENVDDDEIVHLEVLKTYFAGKKMGAVGIALKNQVEFTKLTYSIANVEQNYMIIKQLKKLNANIEEMNENINKLLNK